MSFKAPFKTSFTLLQIEFIRDSLCNDMNLGHIIGIVLIFSLFFVVAGASSESLEYEVLKVGSDENVTISNSELRLNGDILVDGNLSLVNSHIIVNRSVDLTISEIRINSTGELRIINSTISAYSSESLAPSMYTIVSDAGSLIISDTFIDYSMIWLVGGAATIDNTLLDGQGIVNYGVFSEDTILNMNNVLISNYTLGLRSIGAIPTQSQVIFSNCSSWMTQEWWVTFTAVDSTTGLPVSGFQVRQWDSDGTMLGTWNWAKEYEINSAGLRIEHLSNFTAFANFGFARVDDIWSQSISENTNLVRSFNLNLSSIEYKSAEVYASGSVWEPGQVVSKWSDINVIVAIDNPTDYNFSNLFLDMDINNNKGFARESITLSPKAETVGNISWKASLEGPLSLKITTFLDLSSTGNATLSMSKFVEIGDNSIKKEDSSNMLTLFVILIILVACTYIIYSGMEDQDLDSELTNIDKEIFSNEAKEELAISDDYSEEE